MLYILYYLISYLLIISFFSFSLLLSIILEPVHCNRNSTHFSMVGKVQCGLPDPNSIVETISYIRALRKDSFVPPSNFLDELLYHLKYFGERSVLTHQSFVAEVLQNKTPSNKSMAGVATNC